MTVTLREYIDSSKVQSFLRLIKQVDLTMQKCHREGETIIDINLDQIKIDEDTGKIIFPSNNILDPYEKTIASYQTGISINAERKSSQEHNENSIALMILGWYVTQDCSSIKSDMEAVENFDEYIKHTPDWIKPYFDERLKRMNTSLSFSDYYQERFANKINNDLNQTFAGINLSEEDRNRITKSIISNIKTSIKDLVNANQINGKALLGFYEQIALNKFNQLNQQYQSQIIRDTTHTDSYQPDNNNQDEQYGDNNQSNSNQMSYSKSLVKTLSKPGLNTIPTEYDDNNFYQGESYNPNQSGSGFANAITLVLIVGLILLVSLTSLLIFKTM